MLDNNPCTRCGQCCREEVCSLGKRFLDGNGSPPCPALEANGDDTYSCGLVTRPTHYLDLGEWAAWKDEVFGALIAELLGIGKGCCNGS